MLVNFLKILVAVLGVLAGIYTLFVLSPSVDLALQFFSLTFGVLAIMWTLMAYRNLSPNSSLKNFTLFFLFALILSLAHSIWVTLIIVFGLSWPMSVVIDYLFVSFGYVAFGFAAYNILRIGKEFGFKEKSEEIRKALSAAPNPLKKKKNKSRKGRIQKNRK